MNGDQTWEYQWTSGAVVSDSILHILIPHINVFKLYSKTIFCFDNKLHFIGGTLTIYIFPWYITSLYIPKQSWIRFIASHICKCTDRVMVIYGNVEGKWDLNKLLVLLLELISMVFSTTALPLYLEKEDF